MVADQNLPVGPLHAKAAHDAFTAVLDRHFAGRAAECVSAGVDGIRKDVMDRVVDGRLPFDAVVARSMEDGRQRQILSWRNQTWTCRDALQLGELAKDQDERLAHAQIGILLDPVGARNERSPPRPS